MTQANKTPTRRRRVQFSLRTLLAVVTALAVFMGVGCWIGWGKVYAFLVAVDWCGLVLVATLPLMVVILGCGGKVKEHIGKVLVVAGTLLVISLVFTGLSVELLLQFWGDRTFPSLLCAVLVGSTLNLSVPGAAVGLLIAIAFGKSTGWTPSFFLGATLITAGVLASVWYGHYFLGTFMRGESLADCVWWL